MATYSSIFEYGATVFRTITNVRPLYLVLGSGTVMVGGILLYKTLKKKPKLPPGPRALPVIGNMWDLYRADNGLKYMDQLYRQYGDIYTLHLGPMTVVVLNSAELIREAFIRQGERTSGRPTSFTLALISDGDKNVFTGQPTALWKAQRRLLHEALRLIPNSDTRKYPPSVDLLRISH